MAGVRVRVSAVLDAARDLALADVPHDARAVCGAGAELRAIRREVDGEHLGSGSVGR